MRSLEITGTGCNPIGQRCCSRDDVTLPSDTNGRDNGYGAQFVGFELTSTDEIFRFRAQNGYADAMPTPVDTDEDGITDRLCWVTWYSTSSVSFNREGMVGCHDLNPDPPLKEWVKVMNRGNSGNDNDEIAASVIVLDLDGQDPREVIVGLAAEFSLLMEIQVHPLTSIAHGPVQSIPIIGCGQPLRLPTLMEMGISTSCGVIRSYPNRFPI